MSLCLCAGGCIDRVSVDAMGSLWNGVKVFILRDDEIFEELGTVTCITLLAYHVDRILQLTVTFRWDRFNPHFLTCMWTLLVLDWWHTGRDLSILASIMVVSMTQSRIGYP